MAQKKSQNKFYGESSSGDSDESSGEEQKGGFGGVTKPTKKVDWALIESSDSEDEQRVVKPKKDRRFDEFNVLQKGIKTHMKNQDFN